MQDIEEKVDDDTLSQILREEDAGYLLNLENKINDEGEDIFEEKEQTVGEGYNTRLD